MLNVELDPGTQAAYHCQRWASSPDRSLVVCLRDLNKLSYAFPRLFKRGLSRLFQHKLWPCIYVTLVATVVAVHELEDTMEYSLDDGSSSIDVQIAKFSKSSEDHGVYSCYVPGQSVLKASPRWKVGDVLHILGRVFERRDLSRAVEVETCERVEETEEPQHILRALRLSIETYSYAPYMPPECRFTNQNDIEDLALDSIRVRKDSAGYSTRDAQLKRTSVGPMWENSEKNWQQKSITKERSVLPTDTHPLSTIMKEQNTFIENKAQHIPAIKLTAIHPLRGSADTNSVPSTQSFIDFLKQYLTRKATHAPSSLILRGPSAIPRFTLSHLKLSATVVSEAGRLIIHKSPNYDMPSETWDLRMDQLLRHCMRKLVRAGVLLNDAKSRSYQVICPPLIAAYIAVLVNHTPRRRAADIRCFSSRTMRQRVCGADRRLHTVSLIMFDMALELLEQCGLVKKVHDQWCARAVAMR